MSDIDARFDELIGGFEGSGGGIRNTFDKAADFARLAIKLIDEGFDKAAVRDAVVRAWERLVVPFDMPWIPEFIERRIEDRALNSILDLLDAKDD